MYVLGLCSIERVTHLHLVFNGVPSSCFPSSTGLGSSFDVDLALKVGQALGDEARAKGMALITSSPINLVFTRQLCRMSYSSRSYREYTTVAFGWTRI
jgi:beta-glucosidase-like glycosyl hydrolase